MKRIKENKGITLVALIITIIVLLILAVVAISAVQGDGIISKAKLARTNYQAAQDEENTTLRDYLTELDKINNESRTGEDDKNGIYSYLGSDNNDVVSIEINGDEIKFHDGYKNKEYICDITNVDEDIMKLEYYDTVYERTEDFLIKNIEEGILIRGDDNDGEIDWNETNIFVNKDRCGNKINFTLLNGMKFNVPSGLYGGGILEINSHNQVHYWEADEEDYNECYCVYNNKCIIADNSMNIIYNNINEIIGLECNGYQCDRIM